MSERIETGLSTRIGFRRKLPLVIYAQVLDPTAEELSLGSREYHVLGIVGSTSISPDAIEAHLAIQRGGFHKHMRNRIDCPNEQYVTIKDQNTAATEIMPILTKGWKNDDKSVLYGWVDRDTLRVNKRKLTRHHRSLANKALKATALSSQALVETMDYFYKHDDLPNKLAFNLDPDRHYLSLESVGAAEFYELLWSAEQL